MQSDNDIITFIGSLRSHAGLQASNLQTWFTLLRGHSLTTLIRFWPFYDYLPGVIEIRDKWPTVAMYYHGIPTIFFLVVSMI